MEPWKKRLMEAAEDGAAPDFTTLVKACNGIFNVGHAEAGTKHGGDTFAKINLTAVGMWCPKLADVGAAVSYHSLGAACSEVEVDVLSGEMVVSRTDLLFDAGHSLNPLIDIGQAEGAFLMGQGFFTQEETIYQRDGTLTSDSTWEYKPPLNTQIPTDFRVELLKDAPFPMGIKQSKAVGEPPLVLAASIYTAVQARLKCRVLNAAC